MTEVEILHYTFCVPKTFVYTLKDGVFSTVTPILESASFNSKNNPTPLNI